MTWPRADLGTRDCGRGARRPPVQTVRVGRVRVGVGVRVGIRVKDRVRDRDRDRVGDRDRVWVWVRVWVS